MDNLARTYSSSVDLPEVYTSLTDTSTVVRKILQTTITVGLITNNVNMESKHELEVMFDCSGLPRTLVGSLQVQPGQVFEVFLGEELYPGWVFLC